MLVCTVLHGGVCKRSSCWKSILTLLVWRVCSGDGGVHGCAGIDGDSQGGWGAHFA